MRKGVSLVEIVIGVTIFAFGIVPIIGLFGRSTTFTQTNSDYLTAMHSSSGYLRSLMGLPFRDIPIGSPIKLDKTFGSDPNNQVLIPSSVTVNGTTFSYRLRSTNVNRNVASNDLWFQTMLPSGVLHNFSIKKRLLRLELEVRWKSKMNGEDEELKLFVYKADLG